MNTAAVLHFDRHIAGKNIMTPNRLDVGWTSDGQAFEFCSGEDFDRNRMWGVTILTDDTGEAFAYRVDTDRSELFNLGTTEERWTRATDFIAEIQGQQDGSGYRQQFVGRMEER